MDIKSVETISLVDGPLNITWKVIFSQANCEYIFGLCNYASSG